jgi:hypothetical protein
VVTHPPVRQHLPQPPVSPAVITAATTAAAAVVASTGGRACYRRVTVHLSSSTSAGTASAGARPCATTLTPMASRCTPRRVAMMIAAAAVAGPRTVLSRPRRQRRRPSCSSRHSATMPLPLQPRLTAGRLLGGSAPVTTQCGRTTTTRRPAHPDGGVLPLPSAAPHRLLEHAQQAQRRRRWWRRRRRRQGPPSRHRPQRRRRRRCCLRLPALRSSRSRRHSCTR